jgi:SAM-dependent methyltransferase
LRPRLADWRRRELMMTADTQTHSWDFKVSPKVVLPHAYTGRTVRDKLRSFAQSNPRLVTRLANTLLRKRSAEIAENFLAYSRKTGFEFTYDGASKNIPFIAPLLMQFAARPGREAIRYLEIGVYEGQNLAFLDWLLPGRLEVTAIDPWFDEETNPDETYHAIEARFHRNMAKTKFKAMNAIRSYSGIELPKMLTAGERFDLIYVDGSHTALEVLADLCSCASLLAPGGMMVLDDYRHDISEISGPGVKQAVDHFLGIFGRYFRIMAIYRQVVLLKIDEIPR